MEARRAASGPRGGSRVAESVSMYAWGVPVTRRHIIQFVAHTRGGAHYDMDRTSAHEGDRVFQVLDFITDAPESTPIRIDGRQLVYNELLSIRPCPAPPPHPPAR